jgi:hypothetical protein
MKYLGDNYQISTQPLEVGRKISKPSGVAVKSKGKGEELNKKTAQKTPTLNHFRVGVRRDRKKVELRRACQVR